MPLIAVDDLLPFAPQIDQVKAQAMIDDALALAARVAPCIIDPDFEYDDAAKAILRGAILRWNDSGSGAITQQSAGPYSQTVDTRHVRRSMFWPSEITELQALCQDTQESKAFAVDTAPQPGVMHPPFCSVYFGGACSCGVAAGRIYEVW